MLGKQIGRLIHPYLDVTQELCNMHCDERVLSKIFAFLKSNKVLFRVLDLENSEEFPMKRRVLSDFMTSFRAFEESYKYGLVLRRELLDIIAKLNERSIKNVLIKSLNTLPLDSDNFDILVKEKDLFASFKVLRDSGFVRISWYHEPYKWLFRKAKSPSITVHIHTAIAWDGIEFVDVKDLWEKHEQMEINGEMVGFPSPEHHLLITTAHAFFENREVRLGDLIYLIQDLEDDDIDWSYVMSQTIRGGWFDSFHGLLWLANHMYLVVFEDRLIPEKTYVLLTKGSKRNRSDLAEKLIDQFDEKPFLPMKISIATVALQLSKKILKTPQISFCKKTKMILHLFNSFVKRRIPLHKKHPAFLVCFIGQDGTGKTTHARYIWKELRQISKKLKVKYMWSRGFGYSFKPFLIPVKRLLLGGGSLNASQRSHASRSASLLKREPMKSLWACVMIADHLLRLAGVWFALFLGYVVICDRWIIDTLMDVKCDLGKPLSRFSEGMIERLAPKPKLAFIMDTDTSELMKRRPKVNADLLEYKRYLYLNHSQRKGFQVIRTHDNLERNRKTILSTIIKGFFSQSI